MVVGDAVVVALGIGGDVVAADDTLAGCNVAMGNVDDECEYEAVARNSEKTHKASEQLAAP